MAALRGRGLRPGGIVRALVRLVLLVAVGFAVGLGFGLVTEEPELLARHLRGETESVVLDEASRDAAAGNDGGAGDEVYATASTGPRPMVTPAERAEAASLPRVAAPAPGVAAPERPVAKAVAERALPVAPARETRVAVSARVPETARRTTKTATSSRSWAIQVGAFSEKGAATKLADTLADGYPVEVLPATREGGRWRVRVQPIAGEDQARKTAEQLKREEGLPTWVTPMEGRAG